MVWVFFRIHIAISHRIFRFGEKFIKLLLCAFYGLKSQRPSYSVRCFFSPAGVISAGGVDNLDFVLHDLFKAHTSRAGKFGLAKMIKPGQVYLPNYESTSFLYLH